MKKFSKTLAFAAGALFALASLFASCSDGGGSSNSGPSLKSITINTDNVDKSFLSGSDAFSSEGLTVTAVYSNNTKKVLNDGEYTLSGYQSYVNAENKLELTGTENKKTVSVKVEYQGKSAKYDIVISKAVTRITLDATNAVTDFFTGDDIALKAVEKAVEGAEQEAGFIVKAFYLSEDDEAYADEEGEVVTTGVTFTGVENTVSAACEVKAFYFGLESDAVTVNVYAITGEIASEYQRDDASPSLSNIKVLLADAEQDSASVVLKKDGEAYTDPKLSVGTYQIVVSCGSAEKVYKEFTVARPDSENFKIIASETRMNGAAIEIVIDASDMNVKWAENVEKVKPEVTLSSGTVSATPGAFFTSPTANTETNVLEKFVLQIVLTQPVTSTKADVFATIAGTKYKATVRFANSQYISPDYVPSNLVMNKTAVTLGCEQSTDFSVTDSTYGLDYSNDVEWSLVDDTTSSSIVNGRFTAATVEAEASVTVRATLKFNADVYAEATVTIDPNKADVSSIYNVELYNNENNGAFFRGKISWTDASNKVTEISKAQFSINQSPDSVQELAVQDGYTTFMINSSGGAVFRGKTGDLSFRVKTESGAYYDIVVNYTDSFENVTGNGSITTVNSISIEDAVLNPALSLSKENIEVLKDGSASVEISYSEIADFDATKLSAESSDTAKVTASLNGTTLSLSGLAEGEATVTVKYDNSDTVKAVLNVSVVGELKPFDVAIVNFDGGAYIGIDVVSNSPEYTIKNDNSALTNAKLTMDGDGNRDPNRMESITGGFRFVRGFASANMANNPAEHTLTFTLETEAGQKYDFTVVFNGAKNTTITPNSVEIVPVKELLLSSEKLTFNALEAQTVTVSSAGIEGFDVSSVTVASDKEDVATVEIADGTITVTPVADGKANITVTHGEYTKTIAVTVQTSLEEVALVFKNTSKITGSGLELYWENAFTQVPDSSEVSISVVFDGGSSFGNYNEQITGDSYKPIWFRNDGLHFTVSAGFPGEGDFTHAVTVSFVQDGKKYTGTCNFEGNAFVAPSGE